MKNKLLVSVFAMAIAAFAFTSCESESNVSEVCTDMLKETMRQSVRSLQQLDGQKLTISEFEFLKGEDNKLLYRTIASGNGVNEPKVVDTLSFQYGEWGEHGTSFSLLVTPSSGEPYTLIYQGNALITPDGRAIGGDASNCVDRVDRFEKVLTSFPNADWESNFEGEFVMDSVFKDSIKVTILPPAIPPFKYKYDTLKVFTGKMDTVSADTTCTIRYEFKRDPSTFANTGSCYKKGVRSKYNRETKQEEIIREDDKEYDFTWFISDVTSDKRFVIMIQPAEAGAGGEKLNISKYTLDADGNPVSFLLGGLNYTRPQKP